MKLVKDFVLVLILSIIIYKNNAARILAVYPTPSFSHQIAFRPLTLELIKRGHEVVVLTTDPIFQNGERPANLTEIDLHNISYSKWNVVTSEMINRHHENYITKIEDIVLFVNRLFETQMSTEPVKKILKYGTKRFDLLLVEAYLNTLLGFSHLFNAPVIQISSCGAMMENLATVGASMHPLIYPTITHRRIFNLTYWEKFNELFYFVYFDKVSQYCKSFSEDTARRIFGHDMPSLNDLKNNVAMLFLNVHSIWENNRPVPPNVIYLGGLHQKPEEPLPKDLKMYLDSSKNGVLYVSFGTSVKPELLAPNKIKALVNVLSKLPYDVLLKWNQDELPGRTQNIKIFKWLPQADVLRHPKIKLFITQGGMQSTDEAITAGVPLIGIPILVDQWYNVEQYVNLKIGVRVNIESLNEDVLRNAVNDVLHNDSFSFRQNIKRLRSLMYDQPHTALERAIWWTEYVLRHGDAKYLRAAGANISWAEYLELELVFYVLLILASVMIAVILVSYKSYKMLKRKLSHMKFKKS